MNMDKINLCEKFLSKYHEVKWSEYDIVGNGDMVGYGILMTGEEVIESDEFQKLKQFTDEFYFFQHLHRQGHFDNMISLLKIIKRLDVNIEIDMNINDNDYDKIWKKINEQITIPKKINEFIEDYDREFNKKVTI
mgnify:FL=1